MVTVDPYPQGMPSGHTLTNINTRTHTCTLPLVGYQEPVMNWKWFQIHERNLLRDMLVDSNC